MVLGTHRHLPQVQHSSALEEVAKKVQERYKKMEEERDTLGGNLDMTSQDTVDSSLVDLSREQSFDSSQDDFQEDSSMDLSQEESFDMSQDGSQLDSTPAEFLLKPPIADEELRAISPRFHENIAKPLELFHKEGYAAYKAYLQKEKEELEAKAALKEEQRLESLQDAAIVGNPRGYQMALFEHAKQRNTVIHLGTGKGKTLIALLVIRHFASAFEKGKQTLFLVPSVALAIQQTTTLQANLPYTVATACRTTTNNEQARQKLAESNIIVATHGAMHDLLMHYEDLFTLERFNLVVLDECHYATRNHVYASIMQTWYHPLPEKSRPHILGLTASPLLNVKHTHSDEQLETMLGQLENRLDSKLVCLKDLDKEGPNMLHKAAEETHVLYRDTEGRPPLPSCLDAGLHETRIREFQQLDDLYENLGPLAVSIYCRTCAREVSRNHFEKETLDEFRSAVQLLLRIADFCDDQCLSCREGGRSDKLLALEEQLERLVEQHGGVDTVGLVFVDRRITALALHAFFKHRQRQIDQETWTRAGRARREAKKRRDAEMAVRGTFGKEPTAVIPDRGLINGGRGGSDRFDDPEADLAGGCLIREPPVAELVARRDIPVEVTGQASNIVEGQFDDADESEDYMPTLHIDKKMREADVDEEVSSVVSGQFSDASDDAGFDFLMNAADNFDDNDESRIGERIRSNVMVRRATHVFKYLSGGGRNEEEDSKDEWLHKETRIREVMRQLRKKEINVLFATSIVEEGVDVQACSFVIVFDSLKSAKSYIQMKGRARKTNARFVVLQNEDEKKGKGLLALATAQVLERRVHSFVEKREAINIEETEDFVASRLFLRSNTTSVADELRAVESGVYQAEFGSVDLISAKGLLNKYAMAIPLDPSSRTTRESFQMHMPVFENYQLMLPAHLPTNVRLVRLPDKYHEATPTERQQILALMACVRLHRLRLLSDRLLPLTRRDLHEELLRVAKKEVRSLSTYSSKLNVLFARQKHARRQEREVHMYPIVQTGTRFAANQKALGPKGHHRSLAILSIERIPSDISGMVYPHAQLGEISCSLGTEQTMRISLKEWEECATFYATLFNGRWRRRTGSTHFRKVDTDEEQGIISPYIVGCLSGDGKLDWAKMRKIIAEANRTEEELKQAASSFNHDMEPRIWAPLYDPNVPYIAYGPSHQDCGAPFPDDLPGVKTFQDYFAVEREHAVPKESRLFVVQRLWYLQSESLESRKLRLSRADESDAAAKIPVPEQPPPDHPFQVCDELATVLLPIDACMETEVSDAYMALLCAVLPQFLYHIDCNLIADAFRQHCSTSLPCLGKYLERVRRDELMEALAAKSCRLEQCYDRLEWLGDAVLKLLQTDALLQTPDLRQWVQCLHEGDLTRLRSEMGCNERLADSCKHLGIDKFILSVPLERGKWAPVQLKLCPINDQVPTQPTEDQAEGPGMKVCADVIEAFLGLIYLSSGYEASVEVAHELGISLPTDDEDVGLFGNSDFTPRPSLLKAVAESFGKESFESPQLVEEALTHPSAVYQDVSSYQRLEWVGDAVLCLAMREWIYHQYYDKEVGDLVNLESALVSNETLAYLSFQNGLHTFINHRDQGLPLRLEHYEWCVKEQGRGLWGTDPPKVISDVVEAVLGAAHVDGGFGDGQDAALTILKPITQLLTTSTDPHCTERLSNPKTVMHALAGEFLRITVSKEEDFARSKSNELVWQGDQWRNADEEAADYVATISCLGEDVLSIVETTRKSARNRACAMVVALMEDDPELLQELQRVRGAIDLEKSHEMTSASIDEGDDKEGTSGDDGDSD